MRHALILIGGLAACGISAVTQAQAQIVPQTSWSPSEQTKTYFISGATPIELYSSIGEHGPKVGKQVRAIAHTDFTLTWRRQYVPQPDGACTLTEARPNVTIIYTLPKPSTKLAPDLQAKWDAFATGIEAHEKVHGTMVLDLVRQIEAASIGLSLPNDPKCSKVRAALQEKIGGIFRTYQQRNRDFDKTEMSDGGNVQQLILRFVNQPR